MLEVKLLGICPRKPRNNDIVDNFASIMMINNNFNASTSAIIIIEIIKNY